MRDDDDARAQRKRETENCSQQKQKQKKKTKNQMKHRKRVYCTVAAKLLHLEHLIANESPIFRRRRFVNVPCVPVCCRWCDLIMFFYTFPLFFFISMPVTVHSFCPFRIVCLLCVCVVVFSLLKLETKQFQF